MKGVRASLTRNREPVGLVRKGQALVFSIPGEEVLNGEVVNRNLAQIRDERDDTNLAGLRAERSLMGIEPLAVRF